MPACGRRVTGTAAAPPCTTALVDLPVHVVVEAVAARLAPGSELSGRQRHLRVRAHAPRRPASAPVPPAAVARVANAPSIPSRRRRPRRRPCRAAGGFRRRDGCAWSDWCASASGRVPSVPVPEQDPVDASSRSRSPPEEVHDAPLPRQVPPPARLADARDAITAHTLRTATRRGRRCRDRRAALASALARGSKPLAPRRWSRRRARRTPSPSTWPGRRPRQYRSRTRRCSGTPRRCRGPSLGGVLADAADAETVARSDDATLPPVGRPVPDRGRLADAADAAVSARAVISAVEHTAPSRPIPVAVAWHARDAVPARAVGARRRSTVGPPVPSATTGAAPPRIRRSMHWHQLNGRPVAVMTPPATQNTRALRHGHARSPRCRGRLLPSPSSTADARHCKPARAVITRPPRGRPPGTPPPPSARAATRRRCAGPLAHSRVGAAAGAIAAPVPVGRRLWRNAR